MAAPTTIHDLPDDMLHEIFERVFFFADKTPSPTVYTPAPPKCAHLALRCVCRRWRDIADWVRVSTSKICVETPLLADVGAVRVRHPAAFKKLSLAGTTRGHSISVSRAASSLINGSADLRRALQFLELQTCCLPAISPAVTPIASCTALTQLNLSWGVHKRERVVPSNMLAPLSALQTLETLVYSHKHRGESLSDPALLAPLPALPDAPRLTSFGLHMVGNLVPVGSDAALGRLRRLSFANLAPVQKLMDAEDPLLLRAAFDAGTWQPSRLTGLQQLIVGFGIVRDFGALVRPPRTRSRSGSEWAPLAGQVTSLNVHVFSGGYKRPSTGIVAGLGALTALRDLSVVADGNYSIDRVELMSIDRVQAPHLRCLVYNCVSTPANVARFPNLVFLHLVSITHQPPLNLRSLMAQSSLKTLQLASRILSPCLINLAELFVGSSGWPALEELALVNAVLEWDATGLSGAPTAPEFAERARQLLPALVRVKIDEPRGPNALPDRSRVAFVVACCRHVVPALLGLHAGRN